MRYTDLNADNRIVLTAGEKYNATQFPFDFPADFDFDKHNDYKIIDAGLVYDPVPVPTPPPTAEERLAAAEEAILGLMMGG